MTGLRTECKASELTATLTVPSMKDSGGTINITEMGFCHSQTGRGMKGNGKTTLCRGLASLQIIWVASGKDSIGRESSRVELRTLW